MTQCTTSETPQVLQFQLPAGAWTIKWDWRGKEGCVSNNLTSCSVCCSCLFNCNLANKAAHINLIKVFALMVFQEQKFLVAFFFFFFFRFKAFKATRSLNRIIVYLTVATFLFNKCKAKCFYHNNLHSALYLILFPHQSTSVALWKKTHNFTDVLTNDIYTVRLLGRMTAGAKQYWARVWVKVIVLS